MIQTQIGQVARKYIICAVVLFEIGEVAAKSVVLRSRFNKGMALNRQV